jgi:hypothetical protein
MNVSEEDKIKFAREMCDTFFFWNEKDGMAATEKLISWLIENGWSPPVQRSSVPQKETVEEMIHNFKKGYSPL